MRIKKHKNTNEYLLVNGNYWIRNFVKKSTPFIDINNFSSKKDYELFLRNEIANSKLKNIDTENLIIDNCIIVSDGFKFEEKQSILSKLSKNINIIGTNGALAKWKLVGNQCPQELKRSMQFYVINNPYAEAMHFIPKVHKYFPKCIASVRTNPDFLENYLGIKYKYIPSAEIGYSGLNKEYEYMIDDYRNPICSAINLTYRFHVNKLLLLCCDNLFEEDRPGSVKANNLFTYPQHIISNDIIDGCLYWLKKNNVKIGYHSFGKELKNASYIDEKDIVNFFMENDEKFIS